jgi:hypothetical protein
MSSHGFLDCGSEIIAASSLLRHLTVIRRYVHHVNTLGVHAKREESKNLLSLPFINSVFLLIPREIEWANVHHWCTAVCCGRRKSGVLDFYERRQLTDQNIQRSEVLFNEIDGKWKNQQTFAR